MQSRKESETCLEMGLEEDGGVLGEDSDVVGDVTVHFAVFGVGVFLEEREVIVEVLWDDALAVGEDFRDAAHCHVTVTLWVLVASVSDNVWGKSLEVWSKVVAHSSCQSNNQI